MNRKARRRRHAKRQQHTTGAFQRKADLLAETCAKAKKQRKGKAFVVNAMERAGYVLAYHGDYSNPKDWRRLPSQAPHAALERS